MIIDCISDLHGYYPELEGGDLLIVAGDLIAGYSVDEYYRFADWMRSQKYQQKIVVGGNHDNLLATEHSAILKGWSNIGEFEYLCDSSIEFEYEEDEPCNFCGEKKKCQRTLICGNPVKKKLKIYGSPWTKTFEGINPHCKAFTVDTEEELAKKWVLIPEDIDILITHSPPYGILDKNIKGEHCGSKSLAECVGHMKNPPKIWCWGHIHEAYGIDLAVREKAVKMINASHVNERYQPINPVIRIEL